MSKTTYDIAKHAVIGESGAIDNVIFIVWFLAKLGSILS